MVYDLIGKKSFDGGKFLGKYWLVIVDATRLFCFKERHCVHCLTRTYNKGTAEEKTIYYHQLLEAKIVLSDDIIVSIATEFIENPNGHPTKQNCELNSFKRLSASLKKMFEVADMSTSRQLVRKQDGFRYMQEKQVRVSYTL